MLSWFDLKPEQDIKAFKSAYMHFVEKCNLSISSNPTVRLVKDNQTPQWIQMMIANRIASVCLTKSC